MSTLSPHRWIPVCLLLALASCGGGGGGGSSLPAPQNLVANVIGSDISLSWDAVAGATEYAVYASQVATVTANANALLGSTQSTNVTLPGLPAGFNFFFAVAARQGTKQSSLSTVASATVPPQVGVDPLFADQWHLVNTGQAGGTPGEDVQIEAAWNAGFSGQGVRIAVVDDGLEILHEDLASNVVPGKSRAYVGSDPLDPTSGSHGTSCAGVVGAAGGNALGGRGAASEAELVGYALLQNLTTTNSVDAMTRNASEIWISSNSWGAPDNLGVPQPSTAQWRQAVASGVTNGRGGKGTVYLWAAGNGADTQGQLTDDSNLDGQANFWGVLAVGAVGDDGEKAFYSESGANLMVCAPSLGNNGHAITTVDRSGNEGYNDGQNLNDYANLNYTNTFNGTSSATPLVAGVVALMLQANPSLSWRDVRILLAQTARVNDPTDPDWVQNGAGYWINHKYGFGVADASAALTAAQNWVNVGPQVHFTSATRNPNLAIPDADPQGVSDPLVVAGSGVQHIEFVRILFDADNHASSGDLAVVLRSPSGTLSLLAEPHVQPQGSLAYNGFEFGSVRQLDEPADGTWTLTVIDALPQDTGTFKSWRLEFYGR